MAAEGGNLFALRAILRPWQQFIEVDHVDGASKAQLLSRDVEYWLRRSYASTTSPIKQIFGCC